MLIMTFLMRTMTMENKLTKEELIWLRGQLKHGDVKKIAKLSGYTPYSVNLFFKGEINHAEILESSMTLLKKRASIYSKFKDFVKEV